VQQRSASKNWSHERVLAIDFSKKCPANTAEKGTPMSTLRADAVDMLPRVGRSVTRCSNRGLKRAYSEPPVRMEKSKSAIDIIRSRMDLLVESDEYYPRRSVSDLSVFTLLLR
jgi:hypothetical protein